jgi:lipopolysaccharide transport system ATP-binding protein
MVLAGYDAHVRTLDAQRRITTQVAAANNAGPAPLASGRRGAITALTVAALGQGDPPPLNGPDLTVTVTASVAGDERPTFGVMLEQVRGVGITVVATHVDGAIAKRQPDGTWSATVTFPDLPLHSGEYVVSGYLADSLGMVIYDEWLHHVRFLFASSARLPGLVSLPHRWS